MHEELQSLLKNENWNLVELTKGIRLVECKWVYKRKIGHSSFEVFDFEVRSSKAFEFNVEVVKYKARSVTKGYTHKEEVL